MRHIKCKNCNGLGVYAGSVKKWSVPQAFLDKTVQMHQVIWHLVYWQEMWFWLRCLCVQITCLFNMLYKHKLFSWRWCSFNSVITVSKQGTADTRNIKTKEIKSWCSLFFVFLFSMYYYALLFTIAISYFFKIILWGNWSTQEKTHTETGEHEGLHTGELGWTRTSEATVLSTGSWWNPFMFT